MTEKPKEKLYTCARCSNTEFSIYPITWGKIPKNGNGADRYRHELLCEECVDELRPWIARGTLNRLTPSRTKEIVAEINKTFLSPRRRWLRK